MVRLWVIGIWVWGIGAERIHFNTDLKVFLVWGGNVTEL